MLAHLVIVIGYIGTQKYQHVPWNLYSGISFIQEQPLPSVAN